MNKSYPEILRQARSSRIKHAYNALVEIRKTFIKSGVETLVSGGLVERLLELLQTWDSQEESYKVKVTDISISILGNMCMAEVTRKQVMKTNGVSVIVQLLFDCDIESIQNRGCRCLANILLSPGSWKLVHDTPIVERVVKLLDDTENEECKQTYIRAIRLLGQTSKHVQNLLDKKCVSVVTKQLDTDQEAVCQSALRCLLSLSNHCCNVDFGSQVVSSGKLELLLTCSKNRNSDALQLIVRLCSLPNFRPDLGNASGIDIFVEFFKSDDEFFIPFRTDCLDVLTLCCKDAVNRVKLRESGSLEILVNTLSDNLYSMLHGRVISALVCFLYDQTSFDVLLENDLVNVLVKQLRRYMDLSDQTEDILVHKPKDEVESDKKCELRQVTNRLQDDVSRDYDTNESEDDKKTLISSEVEYDKRCDSSQMNDNLKNDINGDVDTNESHPLKDGEKTFGNSDSINVEENETYNALSSEIYQHPIASVEEKSTLDKTESGDIASVGEPNETLTSISGEQRQRPVYSIDSPTYQPVFDWNEDKYNKGAKCKERFTPPHDTEFGTPTKVYSPLSNSSYYSPSEGSPQYFSPGTSPTGNRSRSSSPVSGSRTTDKNTYTGITSIAGYSPNTSPKSLLSEFSSTNSVDCASEIGRTSPVPDQELEDSTPVLQINTSNIPQTLNLGDGNSSHTDCQTEDSSNFIKPGYKSSKVWKASNALIKRKRKLRSNDSIAFENNILILLSRISQITDPTNHLVTLETILTLIQYIRYMESPLARAARLLSRVFRNPLCFESLLRLNIPTVIYEYLLRDQDVQSYLTTVIKNRKSSKRRYSTLKYEISSDEAVDSDRFLLTCDSLSEDSSHPTKRRRNYSGEDVRHQYKGTYHKQEESICDVGKSGVAFLEDFSEVADSSFGRGVVEKILCENNGLPKIDLCTALLFITWSAGSRIFYCKQLTVLDQVLTLLQDPQHRHSDQSHKVIIALSVVLQTMDTRSKYQRKTGCSQFVHSWINRNFPAPNSEFDGQPKCINSLNQAVDTTFRLPTDNNDLNCENNSEQALDNRDQGCIIGMLTNHDLKFIVEGETIFANRKCLSKSSEIFSAMLGGHYSEAKQSTITISNTSKDAFEFLVHHLHGCSRNTCKIIQSVYTVEVTRKSTQTLIDILTESDKYLLSSLKEELVDLLQSRYIVPESALPVLKFSVLHGYLSLQKSAISAVMVDYESVENLLKYVDEILCSSLCISFIQMLEDMIVDE